LAVAIVSQKGGVGKITLARLIAVEYAAYGWRVQIADGDLLQTSFSDRRFFFVRRICFPYRRAKEIYFSLHAPTSFDRRF